MYLQRFSQNRHFRKSRTIGSLNVVFGTNFKLFLFFMMLFGKFYIDISCTHYKLPAESFYCIFGGVQVNCTRSNDPTDAHAYKKFF